jgi:hypothetical protein
METEGDRSPCQSAEQQELDALNAMMEDAGLRAIQKLETLLDNGATAEVLRLTPAAWREKPAHERRALITWTEQRIKALSERLCMMRRNVGPEAGVPDYYLRDIGAL